MNRRFPGVQGQGQPNQPNQNRRINPLPDNPNLEQFQEQQLRELPDRAHQAFQNQLRNIPMNPPTIPQRPQQIEAVPGPSQLHIPMHYLTNHENFQGTPIWVRPNPLVMNCTERNDAYHSIIEIPDPGSYVEIMNQRHFLFRRKCIFPTMDELHKAFEFAKMKPDFDQRSDLSHGLPIHTFQFPVVVARNSNKNNIEVHKCTFAHQYHDIESLEIYDPTHPQNSEALDELFSEVGLIYKDSEYQSETFLYFSVHRFEFWEAVKRSVQKVNNDLNEARAETVERELQQHRFLNPVVPDDVPENPIENDVNLPPDYLEDEVVEREIHHDDPEQVQQNIEENDDDDSDVDEEVDEHLIGVEAPENSDEQEQVQEMKDPTVQQLQDQAQSNQKTKQEVPCSNNLDSEYQAQQARYQAAQQRRFQEFQQSSPNRFSNTPTMSSTSQQVPQRLHQLEAIPGPSQQCFPRQQTNTVVFRELRIFVQSTPEKLNCPEDVLYENSQNSTTPAGAYVRIDHPGTTSLKVCIPLKTERVHKAYEYAKKIETEQSLGLNDNESERSTCIFQFPVVVVRNDHFKNKVEIHMCTLMHRAQNIGNLEVYNPTSRDNLRALRELFAEAVMIYKGANSQEEAFYSYIVHKFEFWEHVKKSLKQVNNDLNETRAGVVEQELQQHGCFNSVVPDDEESQAQAQPSQKKVNQEVPLPRNVSSKKYRVQEERNSAAQPSRAQGFQQASQNQLPNIQSMPSTSRQVTQQLAPPIPFPTQPLFPDRRMTNKLVRNAPIRVMPNPKVIHFSKEQDSNYRNDRIPGDELYLNIGHSKESTPEYPVFPIMERVLEAFKTALKTCKFNLNSKSRLGLYTYFFEFPVVVTSSRNVEIHICKFAHKTGNIDDLSAYNPAYSGSRRALCDLFAKPNMIYQSSQFKDEVFSFFTMQRFLFWEAVKQSVQFANIVPKVKVGQLELLNYVVFDEIPEDGHDDLEGQQLPNIRSQQLSTESFSQMCFSIPSNPRAVDFIEPLYDNLEPIKKATYVGIDCLSSSHIGTCIYPGTESTYEAFEFARTNFRFVHYSNMHSRLGIHEFDFPVYVQRRPYDCELQMCRFHHEDQTIENLAVYHPAHPENFKAFQKLFSEADMINKNPRFRTNFSLCFFVNRFEFWKFVKLSITGSIFAKPMNNDQQNQVTTIFSEGKIIKHRLMNPFVRHDFLDGTKFHHYIGENVNFQVDYQEIDFDEQERRYADNEFRKPKRYNFKEYDVEFDKNDDSDKNEKAAKYKVEFPGNSDDRVRVIEMENQMVQMEEEKEEDKNKNCFRQERKVENSDDVADEGPSHSSEEMESQCSRIEEMQPFESESSDNQVQGTEDQMTQVNRMDQKIEENVENQHIEQHQIAENLDEPVLEDVMIDDSGENVKSHYDESSEMQPFESESSDDQVQGTEDQISQVDRMDQKMEENLENQHVEQNQVVENLDEPVVEDVMIDDSGENVKSHYDEASEIQPFESESSDDQVQGTEDQMAQVDRMDQKIEENVENQHIEQHQIEENLDQPVVEDVMIDNPGENVKSHDDVASEIQPFESESSDDQVQGTEDQMAQVDRMDQKIKENVENQHIEQHQIEENLDQPVVEDVMIDNPGENVKSHYDEASEDVVDAVHSVINNASNANENADESQVKTESPGSPGEQARDMEDQMVKMEDQMARMDQKREEYIVENEKIKQDHVVEKENSDKLEEADSQSYKTSKSGYDDLERVKQNIEEDCAINDAFGTNAGVNEVPRIKTELPGNPDKTVEKMEDQSVEIDQEEAKDTEIKTGELTTQEDQVDFITSTQEIVQNPSIDNLLKSGNDIITETESQLAVAEEVQPTFETISSESLNMENDQSESGSGTRTEDGPEMAVAEGLQVEIPSNVESSNQVVQVEAGNSYFEILNGIDDQSKPGGETRGEAESIEELQDCTAFSCGVFNQEGQDEVGCYDDYFIKEVHSETIVNDNQPSLESLNLENPVQNRSEAGDETRTEAEPDELAVAKRLFQVDTASNSDPTQEDQHDPESSGQKVVLEQSDPLKETRGGGEFEELAVKKEVQVDTTSSSGKSSPLDQGDAENVEDYFQKELSNETLATESIIDIRPSLESPNSENQEESGTSEGSIDEQKLLNENYKTLDSQEIELRNHAFGDLGSFNKELIPIEDWTAIIIAGSQMSDDVQIPPQFGTPNSEGSMLGDGNFDDVENQIRSENVKVIGETAPPDPKKSKNMDEISQSIFDESDQAIVNFSEFERLDGKTIIIPDEWRAIIPDHILCLADMPPTSSAVPSIPVAKSNAYVYEYDLATVRRLVDKQGVELSSYAPSIKEESSTESFEEEDFNGNSSSDFDDEEKEEEEEEEEEEEDDLERSEDHVDEPIEIEDSVENVPDQLNSTSNTGGSRNLEENEKDLPANGSFVDKNLVEDDLDQLDSAQDEPTSSLCGTAELSSTQKLEAKEIVHGTPADDLPTNEPLGAEDPVETGSYKLNPNQNPQPAYDSEASGSGEGPSNQSLEEEEEYRHSPSEVGSDDEVDVDTWDSSLSTERLLARMKYYKPKGQEDSVVTIPESPKAKKTVKTGSDRVNPTKNLQPASDSEPSGKSGSADTESLVENYQEQGSQAPENQATDESLQLAYYLFGVSIASSLQVYRTNPFNNICNPFLWNQPQIPQNGVFLLPENHPSTSQESRENVTGKIEKAPRKPEKRKLKSTEKPEVPTKHDFRRRMLTGVEEGSENQPSSSQPTTASPISVAVSKIYKKRGIEELKWESIPNVPNNVASTSTASEPGPSPQVPQVGRKTLQKRKASSNNGLEEVPVKKCFKSIEDLLRGKK